MSKLAIIERPTYRKGTEVAVAELTAPEPEARFAIELMIRMALASATPDGEDSAGRQKLRLATPNEIVERACDIASAAFAGFEKREWLAKLPPPALPQLTKEELE
jgi:hypothetical protein